MEKRIWSKPEMHEFAFAANEYVAACWKINCNVPYGFGFFDKNGQKGYQRGEDDYIAQGSGCGEYHIGIQSDNGPVKNAWWQPQTWTIWGGVNDGEAYEVFHFTTGDGTSNNEHHFSKVEDAEWETNPNAS